jgi:hypothetical protein
MAPQLGTGTFRVRTNPGGPNFSYAHAPRAGATEIWAMHRTDFMKPTAGGPIVSIVVEPIADPPDFCQFVATQGGAAVFEIVEHTKKQGCV